MNARKLSPRTASEVSARLTGLDPLIRRFFSLPEIKMTGRDMEELARAIWLVGYGEAISDVYGLPGKKPDLEPLLKSWGWEWTRKAS